MGDIPPPNSLYPAPPQQQPQSGVNMLANPGQAIGMIGALQDIRLKSQQFNDLAQQPGAVLQGQNISNATAEMQQQEMASKAIYRVIGGYMAGIKDPKPDDFRRSGALAARSFPAIAQKYPDIIRAASAAAQKDPGLLINAGL